MRSTKNIPEPFDFSKVKDFDQHIAMSIPDYETLSGLFTELCLEYGGGGNVLDIGCSTGRFLNRLYSRGVFKLLSGCDPVAMVGPSSIFDYRDVTAKSMLSYSYNWDVIVSMFTLQFMTLPERKETLEAIKARVDKGATFLVAEKVYCDSPRLNSVLTRSHLQTKRKYFADGDILDKDASLAGIMRCRTESEFINELSHLGQAYQVWQSHNFKAFVVTRY